MQTKPPVVSQKLWHETFGDELGPVDWIYQSKTKRVDEEFGSTGTDWSAHYFDPDQTPWQDVSWVRENDLMIKSVDEKMIEKKGIPAYKSPHIAFA